MGPMDFNSKAARWLAALTPEQRAEMQDLTGPLPRWAIDTLSDVGIPLVPVVLPDGDPSPTLLMPTALRERIEAERD